MTTRVRLAEVAMDTSTSNAMPCIQKASNDVTENGIDDDNHPDFGKKAVEQADESSYEQEEQDEEDDYEYTYEDSDAEDEDLDPFQTENDGSALFPQLCGTKRNASPSFALTEEVVAPSQKQSTGTTTDTTTTSVASIPTATTGTTRTAKDETKCPHCHREAHAPVSDCQLLQRWNARTQDRSLGIVVLDAKYLLPAMKGRMEECASRCNISIDQAFVKLHQEHWQLETVLLQHQRGQQEYLLDEFLDDEMEDMEIAAPTFARIMRPRAAEGQQQQQQQQRYQNGINKEDEDAAMALAIMHEGDCDAQPAARRRDPAARRGDNDNGDVAMARQMDILNTLTITMANRPPPFAAAATAEAAAAADTRSHAIKTMRAEQQQEQRDRDAIMAKAYARSQAINTTTMAQQQQHERDAAMARDNARSQAFKTIMTVQQHQRELHAAMAQAHARSQAFNTMTTVEQQQQHDRDAAMTQADTRSQAIKTMTTVQQQQQQQHDRDAAMAQALMFDDDDVEVEEDSLDYGMMLNMLDANSVHEPPASFATTSTTASTVKSSPTAAAASRNGTTTRDNDLKNSCLDKLETMGMVASFEFADRAPSAVFVPPPPREHLNAYMNQDKSAPFPSCTFQKSANVAPTMPSRLPQQQYGNGHTNHDKQTPSRLPPTSQTMQAAPAKLPPFKAAPAVPPRPPDPQFDPTGNTTHEKQTTRTLSRRREYANLVAARQRARLLRENTRRARDMRAESRTLKTLRTETVQATPAKLPVNKSPVTSFPQQQLDNGQAKHEQVHFTTKPQVNPPALQPRRDNGYIEPRQVPHSLKKERLEAFAGNDQFSSPVKQENGKRSDSELVAKPSAGPSAAQVAGGHRTVENEEDLDTKPAAVDPVAPQVDQQACPICLDDLQEFAESETMSMPCGHKFCIECWTGFVQQHMFDASEPDKCLQTTCPIPSCEFVVTNVQIQQVAPELLPQYENRQLHSFVEGHRTNMRWCPGPDCANRVAVKCQARLFNRNNNALVASCGSCQTQFCFRCGEAPHDNRYCELDTPDLSDEGKPVKQCPKCTIKIEKNGGCNRMRCKCGHAFCWICLEDMFDYNHFCGREGPDNGAYAARAMRRGARRIAVPLVDIDYILEPLKGTPAAYEDDVRDVLQKKWESEHVAHYLNRYTAHEQGQRFSENQCERLLEGRAVDFAKSSDLKSATDTDFLAAANKRLVASRRMLKYTYCYAFFLPDEEREGRISQKGLFQNHQERLERFTETLSEISEHALTYEDRSKIVNLIGAIDSCMDAIVSFEEFGATYTAPK